mmetsp:Transcript_5028/g.14660  ORF Transcript_5028/g.14660 Transcript_5028/m.14660 type:complete len:222 (+) Transcript_5028:171-836(+)
MGRFQEASGLHPQCRRAAVRLDIQQSQGSQGRRAALGRRNRVRHLQGGCRFQEGQAFPPCQGDHGRAQSQGVKLLADRRGLQLGAGVRGLDGGGHSQPSVHRIHHRPAAGGAEHAAASQAHQNGHPRGRDCADRVSLPHARGARRRRNGASDQSRRAANAQRVHRRRRHQPPSAIRHVDCQHPPEARVQGQHPRPALSGCRHSRVQEFRIASQRCRRMLRQ